MTMSVRAQLTAGVAMVAASVVAVPPSLAPLPISRPVTSHTIELTAAVAPLWPTLTPDDIPTFADQVKRGIVPSLGAPVPRPNIPAPAPAATNINQAIKNLYNAVEPWVQYGFEVATYAVGWVPWVGWLSPQIMIFYYFGERIVRSITFNVDDWLFGPLPFLQGLGNVARDSWNALVQLGIDEWNFWLPPLPPLPPLPFETQQTTTSAADLTVTRRQPGQTPADTLPAKSRVGGLAATARGPLAHVEQELGPGVTGVASIPAAVPIAAQDLAGAVPDEVAGGVASLPDVDPTDAPVLKAVVGTPRKAADPAARAVGKAPATVIRAVRDSVSKAVSGVTQPGGNDAKAHKSVQDSGQKKAEQN